MTTYRTGNPIGSTDPRDLYDNAENLDTAVNDPSRDAWSDRLGRSRKTMSGMERQFDAAEDYRETTFVSTQADKKSRFDDFIASSGYQFLGDYAAGIEITEYNQIVRDDDGEFWRLSGQVELPYTTTGAGLPEGNALTPLGDAVLRQELNNPNQGARLVSYKTTNVYSKLNQMPVTPEEFGAVGDGVTDDSAAVIAATQASNHVLFTSPDGYVVQGLPIRTGLVYEGVGDVTLRLPVSPSDHMFKTSGTDDRILSGGIIRLKLDGGRTQTYNGADFTSIHSLSLEFWICEDVWFDGFNRGFNGTNNDRMATFRNCRFINNVIGARGGEHTLFIGCDFRSNDIGLAGRFNDLKVSDCKFAYNRIGSAADPDGGQLTNSSFTGCQFYLNSKSALEVGADVSITGCLIVGGGPGSVGVILTHGYENAIAGCLFGQISAETISDHHIVVPLNTSLAQGMVAITGNVFRRSFGASIKLSSTLSNISVSGNVFNVLNTYCIESDYITESSISGNTSWMYGGEIAGFMDVLQLRRSTVSSNSLRTTSTSPVIHIRESPGLGQGSSYTGNTFSKAGGEVGDVFSGHIHGSVFSGNTLTGVSKLRLTSLEWGSIPPVLSGNIGLKTYQNRVTSANAGVTEWTSPFDIDTDVEARNISLQPLNEAAANSMAYVASVDNAAKTFTIRFAGTESRARTFGVQIRTFGA